MIPFFSDIPNASTWEVVEPVHKGWSKDKKYYIRTCDGRELLLRTAEISHYDQKKREYDHYEVEELGIIDFNRFDYGDPWVF
jgi:aminoglycoside phosphotransferase (APT) family kinase protein